MAIKAISPPPEKKYWHDPDPLTRGEWSQHFETITSWFCSSHDFYKSNSLVIYLQEGAIVFNGVDLRYLGPSLRSAASLVYKAYDQLVSLKDGQAESTPGVIAVKDTSRIELPLPHCQLILDIPQTPFLQQEGTVFGFFQPQSQQCIAPGSTLPQALIWVLQQVNK